MKTQRSPIQSFSKAASPSSPGRQKADVFIVDDCPSVLRSLVRFLRACGYNAIPYASAQDLLLASLPASNACLILDVNMPEMNGLQLHAELRRRGCLAPVIFVTALDDAAVRETAICAGAAGFFSKPVDGSELQTTIETLVRTRQPAFDSTREW